MNTRFKKIQRGSLYEEIAEILKESILSRQYRTGDSLPGEIQLSEQFGVSRNVVREAFRSLQSRGFLEIRRGPKGGAFVSDLTQSIVSDNLADLFRVGYIKIDHLTHVRMIIETEIVKLAAHHATPDDLAEMEHLLDEYDGTRDMGKRVTLNCEFHRCLGKASGNPFFSILEKTIMDFTERFIHTINPFRKVVHQQGEHREIFEAVKNRDPDKAFALTQKHIEHLMEEMRGFEKTYQALTNGESV